MNGREGGSSLTKGRGRKEFSSVKFFSTAPGSGEPLTERKIQVSYS